MPECEGWVSKHWWKARREGPEKCHFFMKAPAGREAWLRGAFWKGTAPGEGCGGARATLVPSRDARARGQPGTRSLRKDQLGAGRDPPRRPPRALSRDTAAAKGSAGAAPRAAGRTAAARNPGGASGGGGSRGGRAERGACARPGPGSLLSGRGRRRRQREAVSAAVGVRGSAGAAVGGGWNRVSGGTAQHNTAWRGAARYGARTSGRGAGAGPGRFVYVSAGQRAGREPGAARALARRRAAVQGSPVR